MTGPRKRTLVQAFLLLAATLVVGTVRPSAAARRKSAPATKSHSKTVKKNGHKSNRSESWVSKASAKEIKTKRQRAEAKARPAKLKKTAAHKAPAKSTATKKSASIRRAPSASVRRVAHAPRATTAIGRTQRSASSAQTPSQALDSGVREALQRRQAWAQPRRTALKPAKVQDPPVFDAAVQPAVRESSAKTQPAEPIRMAKASVADPSTNEDLIREALAHRGKPYIWGGASRGGFDCSGLVLYVFRKKRGMMLPHSASAQAKMGSPVAREDLLPGDVVFFAGTYRSGISHVGIYIGENKIIHAANHKRNVRIDSLTGYYDRKYWGARRLTKTPVRFTPEDLQELAPDSSELPETNEP